jgi:hypothetical protein
MDTNLFLKMIKHLRREEEVVLFGNVISISRQEENQAADFLISEFQAESLEYPHTPPPFNTHAALWAAKTVYRAAQLMLYRENKIVEVEDLLPSYDAAIDPSAILSADLYLRFIPDIISHLKLIDPEDPLIKILEQQLIIWHYSGVGYPLNIDELKINSEYSQSCLLQLYTNRIIENRRLPLAIHPFFIKAVSASLGMFASEIWKDFKPERSHE